MSLSNLKVANKKQFNSAKGSNSLQSLTKELSKMKTVISNRKTAMIPPKLKEFPSLEKKIDLIAKHYEGSNIEKPNILSSKECSSQVSGDFLKTSHKAKATDKDKDKLPKKKKEVFKSCKNVSQKKNKFKLKEASSSSDCTIKRSLLQGNSTYIKEGSTIFVGNLPTNTKRQQLVNIFSPYGNILSVRFRTPNGKIIWKNKMRQDLTSVNAYVAFEKKSSVQKALELNGTFLKAHILRVQPVGKSTTNNTNANLKNLILVGNLKRTANDNKLYRVFSNCGDIEYVRTLHSPNTEGCNGTAFVCFKSPYAASLAMDLRGTPLDDRPMNIEPYVLRKIKSSESCGQTKQSCLDWKSKTAPSQFNLLKKGDRCHVKFISKKSEFRGCKADKKKKKGKKGLCKEMKKLADKIAPRS